MEHTAIARLEGIALKIFEWLAATCASLEPLKPIICDALLTEPLGVCAWRYVCACVWWSAWDEGGRTRNSLSLVLVSLWEAEGG